MARRGNTGGDTRRGSSGGTRRDYQSSSQEDSGGWRNWGPTFSLPDWVDPFMPKEEPFSRKGFLELFGGPISYALERTPWGPSQGAGHVFGALGSAPGAMALYPKEVPGQGWSAIRGVVEGPLAISKAYKQDWDADPNRSPWLLPFPKDTVKMLLEGMKADFKDRYGDDWREHASKNSLYNTFDLLSVIGGAARGAALAGAADRLGAAGAKITLKSLWQESSRPGLISTGKFDEGGKLIEQGSPDTRTLEYQPEVGALEQANQPWSASPLMREVQTVNQAISERFPDAPIFGSRSRIQRTNAATMSRVMDRTMGEVMGEETLNALGDDGRSRLYWESQLQDLPSADGNTTMLKRLRDALADAYKSDFSDIADPKFRDVLLAAKKAGFGEKIILKKLDDAIKFDVTSGKNKRRYETAWGSLRQATNLSERTIIDSEGFTALKNDLVRAQARLERLDPGSEEAARTQADIARLEERLANKSAELETMFGNRKNLVLDWLNTQGKNKYSEAWLAVLTKALGKEKAQEMIAIAMVRANRMRPDNPTSYWADKIGMPDANDLTAGGAAAFRERKGLDALFQEGEDVRYAPEYDPSLGDWQLIEGSAESPLEASAFYSPTQKWVAESMPNKMNVAQLRSALIKEAGQDEYYNSGLDTYFQALDNKTIITKGEFLNVLANRLNAYNLKQVVRINAKNIEGDPSGLGTVFDKSHSGAYISRGKDVWKATQPGDVDRSIPHPGEYYEVQFELPGPGRDTAYRGKGWGHWNSENVVVHFRFHVFEEGGIKKMLIEEIQSDWANQWREAENLRRKIKAAPPEDLAETRRIRAQVEKLQEEYRKLRDRQEAIGEDINRATGNDPDPNLDARALTGEWQNLDDQMHGLRSDIAEYWRMLDETGIDDDMGGLSDIPRSVLGTGTGKQSSYINSPIRWMGRFAVENDIKEVILVSREAQLIRNARVDMRMWHSLKGDFAALKDRLREMKEGGRDYIGYEEDIPRRMKEEWGVEGVRVEDAYEGFFRHPLDDGTEVSGKLPGTVFKVDDVFKVEAMKPKSMYQRPPDWNGLPKGATELFAGGKSRIHMFKDGDVSTWIHELAHVALYDLSDADALTIRNHYAGGKEFAKWTEMEHEDFARAFEQYVREGVAPTRPLKDAFAKISGWIKGIWEREKRVADKPIDPAVNEVFARLFKTENGPTVFMPHRPGLADLGGGRTSRAIPRANREIGSEVASRIPLFKQNQLSLMLSGMLNDDPRLLMEHANRVVALARANALREHVLDMAEPLKPGTYPDFDTQYVVKKAGRGVDKATFDALEAADDAQGVRDEIRKFIDKHISDDPEDFKKWKEWEGEDQIYVVEKKPVDMLFKYVTGKAPGAATKPTGNTIKVIDAALDSIRAMLLYANPGFYVTNMVGNSAMLMLKDPASAKYLPHGMREAVKASTRPEAADPLWQRVTVEMGRGPTSGAFSLGSINNVLSPLPGEKGNLAGRSAEWWSHGLGEWGRRSGRVIDDAFRYAAWRQSAAKLGYDTDAKVKALFEHESVKHPFRSTEGGKGAMDLDTKQLRDLAAIRAEAEQLMLDFDSMTPAERAYLQRGMFLYPFTKAAAKYPFYFAGERPITSGVLMEAGHQGALAGEEMYGQRPDLPWWLAGYARGPLGGYVNVGSFSPFNMPIGLAQTLMNIRGPTEPGIQRPIDYTNPVLQMLLNLAKQQNEYGRDVPSEDILLGEAPLPAYLRYLIRKPSAQYEERDFWNTLLRAFRIFPTELSAGMGEGGVSSDTGDTGDGRRGEGSGTRRGDDNSSGRRG